MRKNEKNEKKVRIKMKCMKDRRKMRKYYYKFIIKLEKSEKSDEIRWKIEEKWENTTINLS